MKILLKLASKIYLRGSDSNDVRWRFAGIYCLPGGGGAILDLFDDIVEVDVQDRCEGL